MPVSLVAVEAEREGRGGLKRIVALDVLFYS
jgi:hypothetical protein